MARDAALFTLAAMSRGKIRDRARGGFHRYAVDERWENPHFEKLLPNQAEMLAVLARGFAAIDPNDPARRAVRPRLEAAARDTARFLLESLEDREGADSLLRPRPRMGPRRIARSSRRGTPLAGDLARRGVGGLRRGGVARRRAAGARSRSRGFAPRGGGRRAAARRGPSSSIRWPRPRRARASTRRRSIPSIWRAPRRS